MADTSNINRKFLLASVNGDIKEMRRFVREGANVNHVFTFEKNVNFRKQFLKMTPLAVVVASRRSRNIVCTVTELLKMGADPSYSYDGSSVRYFAIGAGHYGIEKILERHMVQIEEFVGEFVMIDGAIEKSMDEFIMIGDVNDTDKPDEFLFDTPSNDVKNDTTSFLGYFRGLIGVS